MGAPWDCPHTSSLRLTIYILNILNKCMRFIIYMGYIESMHASWYIISLRLIIYRYVLNQCMRFQYIWDILNQCMQGLYIISLILIIYRYVLNQCMRLQYIWDILNQCMQGLYMNCDGIHWNWFIIIYVELIYGMEIYDCMSFFLRLTNMGNSFDVEFLYITLINPQNEIF